MNEVTVTQVVAFCTVWPCVCTVSLNRNKRRTIKKKSYTEEENWQQHISFKKCTKTFHEGARAYDAFRFILKLFFFSARTKRRIAKRLIYNVNFFALDFRDLFSYLYRNVSLSRSFFRCLFFKKMCKYICTCTFKRTTMFFLFR